MRQGGDAPVIGYPDKFELALRFGAAKLMHDTDLTDADRLLLDALSRQAQHGPCKEPRPSIFDSIARARHSAWVELGNRSKMEAMFMYVQAVEALSPEWWKWPELGLVADDAAADGGAASPCANGGAATTKAGRGEEGGTVRISPLCEDALGSPDHAAARVGQPADAPVPGAGSGAASVPPVRQRQKLLMGGWTQLEVENAPARYRHSCAVVGARLFVFGGRCSSGRLAAGLHVLDLLTGRWSAPSVSGTAPELRWGHSMNAFRQWVLLFGGHRQRGCFSDLTVLDTQAMAWAAPRPSGAQPPARGNHAAAVCMQRLWLFGGDAPPSATVSSDVWCLLLSRVGEAVGGETDGGASLAWETPGVSGTPPPPSSDHTATACASRILLIGGSGGSGYVSLAQLWVLDVDALAWACVRCSGAIPRSRAGHGAVAVQTGLRGWDTYVFGGGASATGFDDLHVLDEGWKWQKLDGAPAEPKGHRPPATEGMGMAVSGSLLLVCGGYTAVGATRACLAWGCERTAAGAVPVPRTHPDRKGIQSRARDRPAKTLLLLACPGQAPAQAHAQAAQAALMHGFTELQVVPVNGEANGSSGGDDVACVADGEAGGGEALSQEQALAMLQHRMESVQLQWRSLDGGSSSLLSQAQLVGAVQPCRYKLMAAGRPRAFTTFWIGLMDLTTGRTVAAASASREVPPAAVAWGRAAASQSDELDTESAVIVTQAWRALIKSW